jgi:hypothetical protein
MTDAEFWDEAVAHWVAYYEDTWAIDCARCGRTVEVDDPETRERDAFCDECADETVTIPEEES